MTITGAQLQRAARSAAEGLDATSHGRPFVDKLDVYKVAGRVFLIVTDDPDEPIVTVKCEPGHGRALQHEHPGITEGRYLDKRHWISIGPGPHITAKLVKDLVVLSYDLVLDLLPHDQWPMTAHAIRDADRKGMP
ncbi:MmcQ/YjbR family DNA-binding protein [Glycomyces dulcitolivorans]|uniref:MmcQ/YjbR family DNA-binding protein n=1 Tax=Glycomyces dulcitolivorans TaxID=2200759 RepID=UPI000DD34D76|nr:MmcQ/YjbR family DNA-binding protein [Glycomyces dulcitolivorans]